ncbi:hypothetical protein QBC46DRAFT_425817 [Diplogelasinospora grovesii]|uniref:Uncharacterized protein n=1 Tax=Diplogelasinospora grovesii TaxID=303347 RepID=A0AAN6NBF1_9PEZI|nr:hypothetical protein QBC46DRAFT_425817 [Diplogelasinospora grovesii]
MPRSRIRIREEALDNARRQSTLLARTIAAAINSEDSEYLVSSQVLGGRHLRKWLEEVDALATESSTLEIAVGVAGVTGAGKTSLLSALLGFKDILPSNNAEAATATICKVSYNHSDDPALLYRAEVVFRSRDDVRAELDQFFQDIKDRDELINTAENAGDDESEEAAAARAKSIQDFNDNIEEAADRIRAVWGYTLGQVEKMSTNDLLNNTDPVARILSSTQELADSDQLRFSRTVKPYLDSTYTKMAITTRGAPRKMAIWPLIDHVDMFLKSDILKGGVVLVDLPGLSDISESRASIARRYYEKLAITVIVAPSVRAADERTALNLMTDNQELSMRMDGKFDSRSFCVVLSKIDDIDWSAAAMNEGRQAAIQQIQSLKRDLKNCASKRQAFVKQIRSLKLSKRKTGELIKKREMETQIRQYSKAKKACWRRGREGTKKLKELMGETAYLSIGARNAHLKSRIRDYLQHRHELFVQRTATPCNHDPAEIRVFPVSTKAYWSLDENDTSESVIGFPMAAYTGIPALARWIRDMTIPRRERHSNDECKTNKVRLSEDKVEQILDPTYEKLVKKLQHFSSKLHKQVTECDPLKRKSEALEHCIRHCSERVAAWKFKDLEKKESWMKVSHQTFLAILRRKGGPFLSGKSKGQRCRYNWMEDLAMVFKTQIAGQWMKEMHSNIPNLEQPARQQIDAIWEPTMRCLCDILEKQFPNQKEYLCKQSPTLSAIREELKTMIGNALVDLSTMSAQVHPEFTQHLRRKWEPAFKKAVEEKGGRGSLARRHKILCDHANEKGRSMYKEAIYDMEKQLKANMDKFPDTLQQAWSHGLERLRTQISLIIGNILEAENQEGADYQRAKTCKVILQEQVRGQRLQWVAVWGTTQEDVEMGEDSEDGMDDIPSTYKHAHDKDGDIWSDDEDDDDEDEDEDEKFDGDEIFDEMDWESLKTGTQ